MESARTHLSKNCGQAERLTAVTEHYHRVRNAPNLTTDHKFDFPLGCNDNVHFIECLVERIGGEPGAFNHIFDCSFVVVIGYRD